VDRLATRLYVNYRQSTHAQRRMIAEVKSFVIGAAMRQQGAHFLRTLSVSCTDVWMNDANNTAHVIRFQA